MKADAGLCEALERVFAGESTERVARTALRGLDREERDLRARRLFAISALRGRYLFLARAWYGSDSVDEVLRAYVDDVEEGRPVAESLWPQDPTERLSVERACPPWLAHRLVHELGFVEAERFLAASNEPGPRFLRVNVARIDRSSLIARLQQEEIHTRVSALSPWAIVVAGRANLFGSRAWREGLFEVQDAASQCVALACEAKADDVIVDYCAGRGGKALALAAMTNDQATIWVHDVDERALRDLVPRQARAGATSIRRGLPSPGTADVVLVDAPCSALGPLRRSPDLRWRLKEEALKKLPELQRRILAEAAALVRPGGQLVYATCTVLRAENDGVTQPPPAGFRAIRRAVSMPHLDGGDGFYTSVMARGP